MKTTSLTYLPKMSQKLKNLPVNSISEDLVKHMRVNKTAFIVSPTATGKTTLIPIMLLLGKHYESWKNGSALDLTSIVNSRNVHIICAVPTQTAAIAAASYVASILNVELGSLVGYSIGSQKRFCSTTKILFATTGVVWLKELFQSIPSGENYLILDECQSYTAVLEAALAWGKKHLLSTPNFKLILMSATDTRAARFINAKIFTIQAKSYPVEIRTASPWQVATTICELVREKRNVLCFVSGKHEITTLCNHLHEALAKEITTMSTRIIPLHGELPVEEQAQAFIDVKSKVVVATNVAQTSLTIPDIDAVVDTGLERRVVKREGQFVYDIVTISNSDRLQRMGRAGRTKPGIYVWANSTPIEELKKFPIPEVYVNGLESILLQIISTGIPLEQIEFFHKPEKENYTLVLNTLKSIGAIDSENQITSIGKQMVKIPLSIRNARMVVEGIKRGVVKDVVKIASSLEVGGLKPNKLSYSDLGIAPTSDPINELQLYEKLFFEEDFPKSVDSTYLKIMKNSFKKAYEIHDMVFDALDRMQVDITSTGDTTQILKSYAMGLVDNLFVKDDSNRNWYTSKANTIPRKLSLTSGTFPTKLVMGFPRSLTYVHKAGHQVVLHLIVGVISVEQEFLKDIAPELFESKDRVVFNPANNKYECVREKLFNGTAISEETVSRVITAAEKKRAFVSYLSSLVQTLDTTVKGDLKVLRKLQATYDTVEELEEYINDVIENSLQGKLPNPKRTDWLAKF